MSRVGKKPISVPKGVEVSINGTEVRAKGPKGEICRSFPSEMSIKLTNEVLTVSRPTDSKIHRSLHGLTRTLLANMIQGVNEGFQKSLAIMGTGYRAQRLGEGLVLQLGYSQPIEITPPPGISLIVESPTRVTVSGIDKELVGKIAAQVRSIRPPDPYKGKGIRYLGEKVRHKAGKSGKAGRRK